MSPPKLYGLLLTGGKSSRMGRDKAVLEYGGQTQADRAFDLLGKVCERVFVSSRRDQADLAGRTGRPQIHDLVENLGPAGGIFSALKTHPDAAWLVLACDLPFVSEAVLQVLAARRDATHPATAFRSTHDGLPEPVCAIYEPSFLPHLEQFLADDIRCPRKMLIRLGVPLLDPPDGRALDNVNEPVAFEAALAQLAARPVRLRYFAILRERFGRDEENRVTSARTPAELYAEIAAAARLDLPVRSVRAAINGTFVDMATPLAANDEVTFIPPVAGG